MTVDQVSVSVIDDKLLVDAVLEEKPANEAEALRASGDPSLVELAPDVKSLILSFKQIGRIENLVGFENLTKLCLDNNNIEEIVALDSLVNLKWLDLSFNKIRKIKGLETLTELVDVTFFSNKLTSIDGLDQCKKIECLSIGNNRIGNVDQVIKLREMPALKMLTVAGNPVMSDMENRTITLAYLEKLEYLDYALVEEHERHAAKEAYHDELLDVEEKESLLNEKLSRDKANDEYKAYLDKAGCLFAYIIFDAMMDDDADLEKLKHLPGVKDTIETFRTNYKAVSEEYLKGALEKNDMRNQEIAVFEKTVKGIRDGDDAESTGLIDAFTKSNKEVVVLLTGDPSADNAVGPEAKTRDPYSPQEAAKMVNVLLEELEGVVDELMSRELRQVEKFEGVVDEFDNRLTESKNMAIEGQQSFFRAIEAMEDEFSKSLGALVTDLMDRLAREEIAEDFLDDEAMSLLMDKETCLGVVGLSHDVHIGRILKLEDQARNGETKRYQNTVQGAMNDERTRNRNRVLEIHEWARGCKINISALLVPEDEEEDDGA